MSEEQDNAGIVTHPPLFYIAAALIGVGIDYFVPLSFGFEGGTTVAAIAIFILGLLIAAMGGRKFASDKQSPSVHAPTTGIYTSGIYAYTRNPMYLGVMLWMASASLYFDKLWILIMCVPLLIFMNKVVIEKEEAYLERKFGDEYTAYKNKVRRWI